MHRRQWMTLAATSFAGAAIGCRGARYGHILQNEDVDLVGSHAAGAGVWNPLVDEAVAKLLSRCPSVQPVGYAGTEETVVPEGPPTVCFIGIENKSAEELTDFKDQLYERIDTQVNGNPGFRNVSRRMVEATLLETRLRPDALFVPENQQRFAAALGRQGLPIDYLLYARITSGTTQRNESTQRDYLLTLDMVNIHSGDYLKESATIRKGYHDSRAGKWWQYGPFQQADG